MGHIVMYNQVYEVDTLVSLVDQSCDLDQNNFLVR